MLDRCGVYAIPNIANGMVYIGETQVSFARRWEQHRKSLDAGKCRTALFQADWLKYGPDVFEFRIIEVISRDLPEAHFLIRERHHMSIYREMLYNRNGKNGRVGKNTSVYWYAQKHGLL